MPVPAFNIINGGSHAGNALAMQEFMILPVGASSFSEALRMGAEVYQILKGIIKEKYGQDSINVGDEGGFAPNILANDEGLTLVVSAINKAGYEGKVKIGMDVAASEFWKDEIKKYDLKFKSKPNDGKGQLDSDGLAKVYEEFVAKYPVISIEDPFDQDDWAAYTKLTEKLGSGVQIVGDDLLVTNPKRIEKAQGLKACNALLLKVNQIGTVTESIRACRMAQSSGWGVMVSHRSGETEGRGRKMTFCVLLTFFTLIKDTFIADLVVGLRAGQIKTGAPCR